MFLASLQTEIDFPVLIELPTVAVITIKQKYTADVYRTLTHA